MEAKEKGIEATNLPAVPAASKRQALGRCVRERWREAINL